MMTRICLGSESDSLGSLHPSPFCVPPRVFAFEEDDIATRRLHEYPARHLSEVSVMQRSELARAADAEFVGLRFKPTLGQGTGQLREKLRRAMSTWGKQFSVDSTRLFLILRSVHEMKDDLAEHRQEKKDLDTRITILESTIRALQMSRIPPHSINGNISR